MKIYEFLKDNGISYKRFDHPAVYTCKEANSLIPNLPGAKTKNLFVRDRKGLNHFLLVVADYKSVDLKALADILGVSKLSLASAERLKNYLQIEPGAVSLLSIINDEEKSVQVIIDRDVWLQEALQCHPLVNTSTLVIPKIDVERFLTSTQHNTQILDLPQLG